MKMANTHYIPRFYLRQFADKSLVHSFNKDIDYRKRDHSIQRICSDESYFRVPEAVGCSEVDNDTEVIEHSLDNLVKEILTRMSNFY